ncbi:MAG: DUF4397 domain-containing protein [Bacteroidota bacterium]
MKRLAKALLLTFLVVSVISCTKSTPTSTTNLRFINLSPNAGALDVYANSNLVVGSVGYGSASSYQTINASTTSVSFTLAGTASMIGSGTVAFNPNNYYSAIVYDSVAIIKGNLFQDDRTAPPTGKAFIRFFDYANVNSSIDIIRSGSTPVKLFSSRNYVDHITTLSYISYTAIDPGIFNASAVVAGTSSTITQLPNFEAVAGKSYTLVLKGFYGGTGTQAVFLGPITDQ